MEALIHHFKLVTEGFRVPPGEIYYPIESPRGEMGCFVRADGSSKPARVHMRDPSFVNLQGFRSMVRDLYIADFIATLGMLDPLLGGSTASAPFPRHPARDRRPPITTRPRTVSACGLATGFAPRPSKYQGYSFRSASSTGDAGSRSLAGDATGGRTDGAHRPLPRPR